jgi:membrane-associated protease RseP (regulator of RpoE activity)
MRTITMLAAFVFPVAFGGTVCARGIDDSTKIIIVQSSDERGGWLGVSIQDMTHHLAKEMDVKTTDGALVDEVIEDSPAEAAGIKEEDIIVEVGGKKIADADELRAAIRKTKPDTKVSVTLMRKEEKKTLTATIEKQPRSRSYSYSFAPHALPHVPQARHIEVFVSSDALGMELSPLGEQLGKYFDAPEGKGVLVTEVAEESKAEKAGFKAGDVILKVGKEPVEDVRDVHKALREYKQGEKADVEIIRKGSKKVLTIEVPKMDRHRSMHFGSGRHFEMFKEFNMNIDPPDLEGIEEHHGSLHKDLRKLELELRDLGREIKTKAKELQQELKARFSGVNS